jgi:dockerin type I repeat protein
MLALKAGEVYLSGEVTAAATNSDRLALLNVSGLSGVENLLSGPPFVLTVNARGVPPIFTLPGDFNRDGTVDLADYVVWRKTLGASQMAFTGADGNGDEVVDAADHAVWRANFGQSIASPPPLPGDFNRDAAVDAADYVVWRKSQGASQIAFSGADGNGDGIVDSADHAVWKANFGQSIPLPIPLPPPLPGDFNRDAAVDASDYVTWRKAMGTSTSAFAGADGNGNGLVDDADYAVWRANFGNTLAASAASAAHSVETSEAPPSSGSVQVFATGLAQPYVGSWQNAKVNGIGQPTTDNADPTSPLALLSTSFDLARKTVRQPFRPATAFETQDRGSESDLAFTLHETDRYLTRSQELLLDTVSDANGDWPLESEPSAWALLKLANKKLTIRDELFSKWNEWHHLQL